MDNEQRYLYEAYQALFDQDYHRAIQSFQKAIEENPGNSRTHYFLSITFGRSNYIKEALDEITQAVQLEEDNHSYHLHYRVLLAQYLLRQIWDWMKMNKDPNIIHQGLGLVKQLDELSLIYPKIKNFEDTYGKTKEEQNEENQYSSSWSIWPDGSRGMPHGGGRGKLSSRSLN